jgi:AraC-like DNA-binding protein
MRASGAIEPGRRTASHRLGGYREYAAPPGIAAVCESVWIHQTPLTAEARPGAAHRVLPDVSVSLAFQVFRDEVGVPIDGMPILAGPKLRPQIFDLVPGRELAAVKLKPEWVGPLLGIDPFAVEEQVVNLPDVCPAIGARLHDALWRTRSAAEAIDVLTAEMIRMRGRAAAPSAVTSDALDVLRRTSGRLPCERVAAHLGLSDRHLRRQVHDSMGVPPKTYARILRFVGAMVLADRAERPHWTDVALQSGYYDQSHLIRECVTLTGSSPSELHGERRRQTVGV